MKCIDFVSKASERVLIESQSLTGDGFGGQTNTWTSLGTFWAWVKPMSTGEQVANEQIRGTTTHKVIVRYQSALANVADTSKYRITLDGRVHAVRGLKNYDGSLKNYGKAFQEIMTDENGAEID